VQVGSWFAEVCCWYLGARLLGVGAGVGSAIFKKLLGAECFESVFYIIFFNIYGCIYMKKMQNVKSTVENMKT
jgi:hypothetical protein